jgi:hypothetical protein
MGWLQRLFRLEQPENAQVNPTPQAVQVIPPEHLGFSGEYDQRGLAKRVALAFDQDPQLDDVNTLCVAQVGSTVVLKGTVPSQDTLNKIISLAHSVSGAIDVDTTQVAIS